MELDVSQSQRRVLKSLYFVEPFRVIVEESGLAAAVVSAELKALIAKRWVQVMQFDAAVQDYMPISFYDGDRLQDCHFLATKDGLLALHT